MSLCHLLFAKICYRDKWFCSVFDKVIVATILLIQATIWEIKMFCTKCFLNTLQDYLHWSYLMSYNETSGFIRHQWRLSVYERSTLTMSFSVYVPLLLFVWLPISLYYWALYKTLYWQLRKIPSIYGKPLIGSITGMLTFQKNVAQQFYDFYFDKSTRDKPFVGIFIFHKPAIVIRDPELLKRVLVKDFAAFQNRWVLYILIHNNYSSFEFWTQLLNSAYHSLFEFRANIRR